MKYYKIISNILNIDYKLYLNYNYVNYLLLSHLNITFYAIDYRILYIVY